MNRIKGQNLTEFVIVLTVIAVAAIIGLTFLGSNTNNLFVKSHEKYKGFQPFDFNSNSNTPAMTETAGTGGSSKAPSCSSGSCTIKFGNLSLSGIPENYGSAVETNGTTGMYNSLADLITNIANQISTKDPANSELLKKLANLAHVNADVHEKWDAEVTKCASAADFGTCLRSATINTSDIAIPSNITSELASANALSGQGINLMTTLRLDAMKKFGGGDGTVPAYEMTQIFDKFAANNPDPAVKSLVTKLYQNLSDLDYNYTSLNYSILSNGAGSTLNKFDPVTGNGLPGTGFTNSTTASDILHPKTSQNIDLYAALNCFAGSGYDNGNECK